jgi:hypothetical protein
MILSDTSMNSANHSKCPDESYPAQYRNPHLQPFPGLRTWDFWVGKLAQ